MARRWGILGIHLRARMLLYLGSTKWTQQQFINTVRLQTVGCWFYLRFALVLRSLRKPGCESRSEFPREQGNATPSHVVRVRSVTLPCISQFRHSFRPRTDVRAPSLQTEKSRLPRLRTIQQKRHLSSWPAYLGPVQGQPFRGAAVVVAGFSERRSQGAACSVVQDLLLRDRQPPLT